MLQKIVSLLTVVVLLTTSLNEAQGHFLYVYGEGGDVKVVFGEALEPDQAKFLGGLAAMKAHSVIGGTAKEVTFQKKMDDELGWYETSLDGLGPTINVSCPYGVFNRGDLAMFLDYSGKYVRYSDDSLSRKPADSLSLDMIPSFENGQLKVGVYFKGMPLAGAEVSLIRIDASSFKTNSDDTGTAVLTPPVRYLVRAKHILSEPGEVDGKKYSEKRYYCTMVLDLGGDLSDSELPATEKVVEKITGSVKLERVDAQIEDFPRGMTSFGAAVIDNKLFVTGGKSGRAHSYARSYQNRDVYCLDFDSKKWETVGETLGLQGLAVVSHGGQVVRIGGLEARNEEGEEHELRSLADVKAFNPETKTWTKWPSLPQGRSSFDACVHQDKVYVVGGWTMAIGKDSQWASDMLVLDASADKPEWKSVAVPFQNRALAVRTFKDKLFAIGGINEDGTTDEVHVFDLKSQTWSEGPGIPSDSGMLGFGCSATALNGRFLVSTYDGVYQLSEDQNGWEKIHQLEPGRFFHHMVPIDESSFALVGGTHMKQGRLQKIEVYKVIDSTK